MKATLVYTALFLLVLVYQVRAQPTSEDELGTSLLLSPEKLVFEEDTLGTSLMATQCEAVLGFTVSSEDSKQNAGIEFTDNDSLGQSLINSSNHCNESSFHLLNDFEEDGWLSELKDSIRGPCYTSTPSKPRKELQFDRVMAKQKPVKKLSSYLCKEVQGAKKLKQKALDHEHILSSLKQTCRCGQMCMRKMCFSKLKHLRLSYWSQSVLFRRQLLKLYVKRSYIKGKHRYINVDSNCDVCSRAFLYVLRINKNALSNAIKACEKDHENTPGRCPRKVNENTLLTINWLEDYASFYGDRMPNSEDVMLPYKFRKLSVYKSYLADSSVNSQVSKTQFFKIWKNYFPHLKIKQTNSFSKCATCTILEKHRENAVDYETKATYGQLKDEHHERQHMERRYYYSKRDASRKAPLKSMSIIIDGMDQAKTNLPHFTGRVSKDVNPSDLLKTRVTGVINHGVGGFHTYVDINEYPHDPNLTINVLLKALKKAADRNDNTLPPVLYVQADNCGRENKNKYVLAFLELLVAENIFHEVHLSFLYVGHTHEDIDAAFSKISQAIKGCDIETLPELINVLPEPEEIGQVFDIKEWMEPYLAEMSKISFPLHYKFEKVKDTVKMYYKGPHYLSWVSVEENILSARPQGKPKPVQPDYSKINFDKNLKQIHRLKPLFKNPHSVKFWEEFYSGVKFASRSVKETKWLLDELPRQRDESEEMETLEVPEHIKKIIDKETTVPQVIVKRKKKQLKTTVFEKGKESNGAKRTGQRKNRAKTDLKWREVCLQVPKTFINVILAGSVDRDLKKAKQDIVKLCTTTDISIDLTEFTDEVTAELNPGLVMYLKNFTELEFNNWKHSLNKAYGVMLKESESCNNLLITGLFDDILKTEFYLENEFPSLPGAVNMKFEEQSKKNDNRQQVKFRIPVQNKDKLRIFSFFFKELEAVLREHNVKEYCSSGDGISIECLQSVKDDVASEVKQLISNAKGLHGISVPLSPVELRTLMQRDKPDDILYEADVSTCMVQIIGRNRDLVNREAKKICLDLEKGRNKRHDPFLYKKANLRFEHLDVVVSHEDITDSIADCIVSPVNELMNHEFGVAKEIAKKAGSQYLKECQTVLKQIKRIDLTQCVNTEPGNLKNKHVLLVHTPVKFDQERNMEQLSQITESVRNCLEKAEQLKATSVAFPFVCAGLSGIPVELCAQQYFRALEHFKPQEHLREVKFMDIKEESVSRVCQTMTECMKPDDINISQTFSEINVNGTDVFIGKGQIHAVLCGVIVLSVDEKLHDNDGALKDILTLTNQKFHNSYDDEKKREHPSTSVLSLKSDEGLTNNFVLFAVTPVWNADPNSYAHLIRITTQHILEKTLELQQSDLALPVLCNSEDAEVLNCCCQAMAESFLDFGKKNRNKIKMIHFLTKQSKAVSAMCRAMAVELRSVSGCAGSVAV